jgi:hypothetical protein
MRIYIATPISNRPEKTMEERLKAAKERVEQIAQYMRDARTITDKGKNPFTVAEYCSTFDVNPIGCNHTEAEAMGNCIRLLLECDAIIIDKGMEIHSNGMDVEHYTANAFGKGVLYYWAETEATHIGNS